MKFMKSTIFSIWIVAIAALSVMPYSKNGAASLKLTGSGMVLHFVAYFVGSALFFWNFRKNTLFSILIPSFTIFLYSVVLEIVQLYLPYRTFNPIDIAANGVGIFFFIFVWMICLKKRKRMAQSA